MISDLVTFLFGTVPDFGSQTVFIVLSVTICLEFIFLIADVFMGGAKK